MTVHIPDHASEDCRDLSSILARVGDKWTVLIVALLGDGPKRFNEIKRMVGGISQRMLTLTLRGLERDGIVKRTIFATIPPRVEYELTELGRSLRCAVVPIGTQSPHRTWNCPVNSLHCNRNWCNVIVPTPSVFVRKTVNVPANIVLLTTGSLMMGM